MLALALGLGEIAVAWLRGRWLMLEFQQALRAADSRVRSQSDTSRLLFGW